jgi:hypothetical protein
VKRRRLRYSDQTHLNKDIMNISSQLTGPTCDTASGDIVPITLQSISSDGVNFVPDSDGCAAVIKSFDKLPNGKFGPFQKHGGLHYGDVLFEINDITLSALPFAEVLSILQNKNLLTKVLKFINPKDYYRKKSAIGGRLNDVKINPKADSFLSGVKRTRLCEGKGKRYAEYEIAIQFRVASMKVHREVVYQWSVWKRYSEFEALHSSLKQSLGWQMETTELPPPNTFTYDKLAPDFVEQRRDDLKAYWLRVTSIDKVTDFTKHHCSPMLKEFLQVEESMKQGVSAAADMVSEERILDKDPSGLTSSSTDSNGSGKRTQSLKRVQSMRRKNLAQQGSGGFNYDTASSTSVSSSSGASNGEEVTSLSSSSSSPMGVTTKDSSSSSSMSSPPVPPRPPPPPPQPIGDQS